MDTKSLHEKEIQRELKAEALKMQAEQKTDAFQFGLDAYYEDCEMLTQKRTFFATLGEQYLADFNRGYECAEEQDAA